MSIRLKDTIYDLIDNADKVDGKHASDFATSGHTHNLGNKNVADLSSTYPSGISIGGIYNNGYPFSYGSTITASGNGGYFQIAGQWNSNVTSSSDYDYPTEMYIRGRRDSYDVWTTWSRVLTNRNYTSFAAKHDHTHSNYASKVTVGTTAYTCSSNNITIPAYPTSLKNPQALTIQNNGTTIDSYDGSSAKTINITHPTIPTALKCPTSLTIQLNGTSQGAWDGSTAKTINITPASIGAAASHSHPYLPLSGGTLTGSVTFANGTWNVVGDDAAIGDYNAAGMLGLKSCNNNIPGIGFHNSAGTLLGSLTCDAGTLKWGRNRNLS